MERQHAAYRKVRLPVRFQRQVLRVSYRDTTTPVPVHLYERRREQRRGVLVLCGGVDTWKVELHRLAVTTARLTGLLVAALDMPGTGESQVPLSADGDRVLAGAVGALRDAYGLPIGFLGLSFGGHWAAKLALQQEVDAAIDIGGPTGLADQPVSLLDLPYGMSGIVANAAGLDRLPTPEQAPALLEEFSLRHLVDAPGSTPLLAANGADDQYIPRGDTTGLGHRDATTVWIVRDATHCAIEHFRPLILASWGWLLARLAPRPATRRLVEHLLTTPVRRLLTT
ncbi:alpha/beta hydrolase [Streptomyces sp. 3N207]|uniref:alpha/beta hydrolase n=1 Tax=Streptomyces sp. 3N207 TaxID=3457417 RepID=UPI003FD570BD